MDVGAGHCHPEQNGPGVQTPTLSPILGMQCCYQHLGIAWRWRGGGKPWPWDGKGAWAEGDHGVMKHPSKLGLLFFFSQCLAPLLGTKPADTDGVLQNRAKRQERKEQSYL